MFACVLLSLLAVGLAGGAHAATPAAYSSDCIASGTVLGSSSVYPPLHQVSSPLVSTSGAVTQVQFAKNFNVTYYSTFKVVTVITSKFTESYVLYPCGLSSPDLSAYPALQSAKKFQVPLRAVSAQDTPTLAFMKELNVYDRLRYATSYAVDPCVQALVSPSCGRAYPSNLTTVADAADLDAHFGYFDTRKDPIGVYISATADPGALNRAEWVKFLAPFFNKERAANALFKATSDNYARLKAAVASANIASPPLVAWLTYFPNYPGSPEQIVFYNNQYRRDYLTDAGAQMLDTAALQQRLAVGEFANSIQLGTGSSAGNLIIYNLTLTLPLVREVLKGVRIVIDETTYVDSNGVGSAPSAITLDLFTTRFGFSTADLSNNADFPFLVSGGVFRTDGQVNVNGGTDMYEGAVAHPDVVLQDIILAVNPSVLAASNAQPVYVKSLGRANSATPRATVLSASDCKLGLTNCAFTARPICPTVYTDCNGNLAVTTADTTPCTPTCPEKTNTTKPDGQGGAAGRAQVATPLMLALLATLAALLFSAAIL